MLAFYVRHFDSLRRWVRRHPRGAAALVALAVVLIINIVGTASAIADSGAGPESVPYLPPVTITDSHGVSLLHYAVLPLDRGDTWTMQKTFWTSIVDAIWIASLSSIGWMLWLFQFELSFQWVNWIAAPLTGIGQAIHNVITQIGWVPLALAITALVCGVAILTGRVAKGLAEVAISVLCAALAVGILVNPVGNLTGPSGALSWVEANGGNLAASIASDNPTPPTGTASVTDASKVLSATLTSQLVDLFVRMPAQEIAFGHDLTGSCNDTFTTAMKSASPINTSSTSVRDAVHGCDQGAWDYVTNPSPGMVWTAFLISIGGGALFLLALALGLVLLMCVLYALWSALKLVGLVYAAMLPGVAREGLFKSLIGMYVAVLSVGIVVVVMAGYLRIITSVMGAASKSGMPVLAQTEVVDFLVLALAVGLFIIRSNAKRAGETLASRLSKFGFAGGSGPDRRPNPVLESAKRIGENYVASRMRRPNAAGNTTINNLLLSPGRATAGSVDAGTAYVTRPGGASGGGAAERVAGTVDAANRVRGAISAATTIGAATASGGTSAVVMAVGQVAGKQVMQRAITTGVQHTATAEAPRFRGFGRQIVVDRDGVGTVSPLQAPQQRDGSYRVTSVAKRADTDAQLRRRLAAASKPQEHTP